MYINKIIQFIKESKNLVLYLTIYFNLGTIIYFSQYYNIITSLSLHTRKLLFNYFILNISY